MNVTKEQSVPQLNDMRHPQERGLEKKRLPHRKCLLSFHRQILHCTMKGPGFYFACEEGGGGRIFSENFAQESTCFVLEASSSQC